MVVKYEPKPISFVPPLLRRKFVAPDTPREKGALVVIVGLATTIVVLWPVIGDSVSRFGARSGEAKLVATIDQWPGVSNRLLGVYVFEDELGAKVGVKSKRYFKQASEVPKTAQVAWPNGRPYKAKVLGQFMHYFWGLPLGLGLCALGMWLRRKRPDPYAEALKVKPNDEATTTS